MHNQKISSLQLTKTNNKYKVFPNEVDSNTSVTEKFLCKKRHFRKFLFIDPSAEIPLRDQQHESAKYAHRRSDDKT